MFKKKHFYGSVSGINKKSNNKRLLLVFFAIFIFIGIKLAQEMYREYKINKEIEYLKDEITKYDKENNDLEKMLDYYKTLSYKETEARKKLNLQKPGEKTILIDSAGEESGAEEEIKESGGESAGGAEKKSPYFSNALKWWDYFFKNKIK